ncbi:hypothetical protein AB0J82_09980 [Asanoa sp. NPDC049518]|uniref:hypothetical protein n=1 Tax=unclassified Asanoa TaxID=2685164 RepID=UPI00342D4461
MDALLGRVLDAHGGLDRWRTLTTFTARITYGGPFWEFKGHPGFVGTSFVEASLRDQRIRHRDEATGRELVFDRAGDRLTVTDGDGAVVEKLESPRSTFAGYTPETTWSLAQIGYFRAYATWHYLVEPFLFTWPGVEAHEIEPWTEGGQTWRVLRVTYPETIHTHNPTQLYYYDEAGLLRRMDYAPEVNGSTPVAHYVREHQLVDGVPVPSRRHIQLRNADGTPDLSWTPITLDLTDIELR